MRSFHIIALAVAGLGLVAATPAMAKPVDLTSGVFGSILSTPLANETRGIDVKILGSNTLTLNSLTLNELSIASTPVTVGVRVYNAVNQTLLASGQTSVAAGPVQSLTFPVSVSLVPGGVYRLCFHFNASPGQVTVTEFAPNSRPYTEMIASAGTLRIDQTWYGAGDVFPNIITDALPMTMIDVLGISDPNCFTDVQTGLRNIGNGSAIWGDYDADGDLDVLLTGVAGWINPLTAVSTIYRNSGGPNPTFTDIGAGLTGVYFTAAAWGDYDRDGDLDLLLAGYTGTTWISKVYRNSGGANPTFSDVGAGLPGVNSGSVTWGDYDSDGDLDILLTGNSTGGVRISKVFRNNGGLNPTFTDINAGLIGLSASAGAWGDYDKDGDLDILVCGDSNPNGTTKMYRSSGGSNPTFGEVALGLENVLGGSVDFGDYDSDGDLDILLAGQGPGFAVTRIYRNNGGVNPTFTDVAAGLAGTDWGTAAWGDYDSDGDLDILAAGSYAQTPHVTRVYRSSGGANPTFTDTNAKLAGLEFGSAAWGDYDNDGDLDVLETGSIGGGWQGFTRLYRSSCTGANTPPEAPANLSASFNGNVATFTWSAATDTQTPTMGLSYNLRIGRSPGASDVISAMADNGTGYRRIVSAGNRGQMTSFTIALAGTGSYYWSVQAIDGSFAGSPFAAEASVCGPALPAIPSVFPGVAGGSGTWGDYDQDGDLDLFLSGTTDGSTFISRIYRNNGGITSFNDIGAGLPGIVYGQSSWGDCDNDGDLDLALTGYAGAGLARIYRNSGGVNPTFADIGAGLPNTYFSTMLWADYDSDGDQDLLVAGHTGTAPIARIYRNSGGPNPTFADIAAGLGGVYYAGAAWGDYDNDGDPDLVVSGYNEVVNSTRLYRNSGGANPTFTDVGAGFPGVLAGTTAWEDYDQDGDLDLLLAGNDGAVGIARIYRNSGGPNPTFADISAGLAGVSISAAAWGDYDNDGDPDLLLTGDLGSSQSSIVYRSSGGPNPTFSDAGAGLTGMAYGSAAWMDHENDGDLDLLITGLRTGAYSMSLCRSLCVDPNTPPDAPANLSVSFSGTRATFTWDPSSDAETPQEGLTYNLRVGTSPGASDALSALANGVNGYRHIPARGNAGQRTSLELELPGPGPYYWTVQTIDGAFAGSAFAPEQGIGQSGVGESPGLGKYALWCAGPNPFSSATMLGFSQPAAGRVSLSIYDLAGRLVRSLVDEEMTAGSHSRAWDGRDDRGTAAAAGIYFARLKAAEVVRGYRISIVR